MNSRSAVYPRFFDPERLGQSLKEVSSDLLRVESRDLIGRWFHAPEEIDLFLWTDEAKNIVKQQLTFYGQVVEWNMVEGTKTGVVIEEELPDQSTGPMNASETIRFDENPQAQPLGLAMDLIQHTGALTSDEQKQIIANFFRGQRHSVLNDDEFFKRYAVIAAQPSSLMSRLSSWVRRLFRR